MSYTVIKADLRMESVEKILAKRGLNKNGRVQVAIDRAVIKFCMPYVPKDTGALESSPYTASIPGSGRVVYPGPHARYLYYGEVMGPNIPVFEDSSGTPTRFFSPPDRKKRLTGRPLQYKKDLNPLAGSFWFERMKANHAKDIVKEARAVAGLE